MLTKLTSGVVSAGTSLRVLGGAGILRPYSPVTLARMALTLHGWGPGLAGGFIALALRAPSQVGLVDELGELTFGELHARSSALARGLRELGVGEGDVVAILCRNHRGFVDASLAVAKLGADTILLNTGFAGPQLADLIERDQPKVLIHDEEFEDLVDGASVNHRLVAWSDGGSRRDQGDVVTIESLIATHDAGELVAPSRHGRIIILTSGTTGTPQGVPRSEAGVEVAVSLLSSLPLRTGWRTHIAAPLFHTWGFAHLALSMLLGSTMVLRRRFEPESFLEVLREQRCESAAVVPVMLQRVLALPQETLARYDLRDLQVVATSGSSLPGDLATTWMDRFGDNLYSTYGSTEVAYAAIATPMDLRADPTTAGRPPWATSVKVLDEHGTEVAAGTPGRIFVGNGLLSPGYTAGGHKEVVNGLMASGDVGRFGHDGRLHVEGRDDEMIVSGGENVFPQEVEDCLARHASVAEAAAVGVSDDAFGQRLRAFVVLTEGASVTEGELREWVRSNLARFKVPGEIVFLDQLPRNATGKVLKRDLVETR